MAHAIPFASHAASPPEHGFAARVARTLAIWRHRARERADLAMLTEYELSDFGLTPSEALFEARKPFWRE